MNEIFTVSNEAKENYLATICRIGKTYPIEGADRLVKTVVNGYDIVISNDMKEGDIVIYFPIDSVLCDKYLTLNNLYSYGDRDLNMNYEQVQSLVDSGHADKARRMVGFFTKSGRVKRVSLKGCPSLGYVANVDSLVNMDYSLKDVPWSVYVGTKFDTVNGTKLCWKFLTPVPKVSTPATRSQKANRKLLKKYKIFIPGQFEFHYGVKPINECMGNFSPDDSVTITTKIHGTSAVFSNILCNRELTLWEKIKRFFGKSVNDTEYRNIFSSHCLIKNDGFDSNGGFYEKNLWKEVNNLISPFIEEGMTIYGEICGYVTDSIMIQKNHDYGCKPGEWKFMPYRISTTSINGDKYEWNLMEVDQWVRNLVSEHPELGHNIMYLDILYHGRFGDLYRDVDEDENWRDNVLAKMKKDKNFRMEEKEPMCKFMRDEFTEKMIELDEAKKNGAGKQKIKKLEFEVGEAYRLIPPREGIVIRKDYDKVEEAWKLKTDAHYAYEEKMKLEGAIDLEEAEEQMA